MGEPVVVTTSIDAPPRAVYDLVSDLPRMGEWSPENEGAEWLRGARKAAVGATFKGANRHGRRTWTTRGVIVAAEPGRTLAFKVSALGLPVAEWRYELATSGTGCTVTETFTDRRGFIPKLVGKVAIGISDRDEHNRQTMQATLAALKLAAEADAAR